MLNAKPNENYERLSGWGNFKSSYCEVLNPKNVVELREIILNASPNSIIPRGLGRSYGDSSTINQRKIIKLEHFNSIKLDIEKGVIQAGSGATLEEILKVIIPNGLFVPVTPGTKFITIGGAIASDIHGKNHHVDGSFGNHTIRIKIMNGSGEIEDISPNGSDDNAKKFWATIGGMGLTGIILEVEFKLIRISTSFIHTSSQRFEHLDDLMNQMIKADNKYRYTVAWIDSMNKKFRGVLSCGNHALPEELSESQKKINNLYETNSIAKAPKYMPNGLLNKYTISIFNEMWYRKYKKIEKIDIENILSFFYPLDGVKNWNNIYGESGFIQYQYSIPDKESDFIHETFEILKEIEAFSFLTVLKRFGNKNKSYLSFPMPGWTLAIDIPAKNSKLLKVLDRLDESIIKRKGHIYLAKDVRQKSRTFLQTYPDFYAWKEVKLKMDPRSIFTSDQYERLTN